MSQAPPRGTAENDRACQRGSEYPAAHGGIAVGQVDGAIRWFATLRPWRRPRAWRQVPLDDNPTANAGSRIDSSSALCSVASRDPSRMCALMNFFITSPAMAMASDALSPAAVHNSRNSSNRVADDFTMDSPVAAAQHGARGDAHRLRGWGHRRATRRRSVRARSQLIRAAAMSRLVDHVAGAHVPAVGGVQITCGLEVFGDQRGVLVGRCRVTRFDRGGHAPMQLGAIRFELRLVGHRANQRMVEHILGLRVNLT